MIFSSVFFLFCFLPVVLLLYWLTPGFLKNSLLLLVSLVFYAWGEGFYVLIMLSSILFNFIFGLLIEKSSHQKLIWFIIGLTANILLLVYFKYYNFLFENITSITDFEKVHLPIGISFFTFQSISYLFDVYRNDAQAQKNPINIGLYIALFPQLIAGPIVRFTDVMEEIKTRTINSDLFVSGINRFIIGLGKKVVFANPTALIADRIFGIAAGDLTTPVAWLGIICYTLQIYFDFSGYSDMAIGLGRMFGFKFLENFNFPYIAKSIQDFWRRWHISLSSWFRDYLYIPLGGNRVSHFKTYFNLVFVFFITGLWHGASWNFIFWGLFHGLFLIIERLGFSKLLAKCWSPIAHIYTLLVVSIGWVFFRVENITDGFIYTKVLFGIDSAENSTYNLYDYLNTYTITVIILGIVLSMNVFYWLINKFPFKETMFYTVTKKIVMILFIISTLLICASELASNTYNPFIYFRF
jgi:alginate O-acetyltransferase complex protein AlgI